MDPSFIPVEVVPSKTPFGLDQLRRSYKTALGAEAAIAAAPAVGTADETFPNMFLMPISTPESAERATRIDLLYMGCLAGAEGSPTLPAQKTDYDSAVQSASSSRGTDGVVLSSPGTVQFYAPSSELSYFSFGAPGTELAPDPEDDITIITYTFSDTSYSTGGLISNIVALLFTIQIVETHRSTEIVPGQYWQNVSRKTKVYVPFIFDVPSGGFLTLANHGSGYTVGDDLTVSVGGESAVVDITAVGSSNSILAWTETSNTFTAPHNLMPASGGTGTGAKFNVAIIP